MLTFWFLIRLAVPPVGMCLGLVIPSEKNLGENQDHIQSSQVALRDFTGKQSKRFSMCVFILGMTLHYFWSWDLNLSFSPKCPSLIFPII